MEIEDLSGQPASVGFDRERLKRLDSLVQGGIESGLYPAVVYTVLRHGKIVAKAAKGFAQPDSTPARPTRLDTIFDLASITKPIVATLLLQAAERGELHLGQRVLDWIPEAEGSPVGPVTLRQLATHTSGLPAWKALYQPEEQSALTQILATPLENAPGTHYTYSDLGYILIGHILPRATSEPLDKLAEIRIFRPLRMRRTFYCPPAAMRGEIAACANCSWRPGEILIGEVHDANAHSLNGVSGHAGLFSTAADLATFAIAFQHPEAAARASLPPVLGPLARKLAQTNQIAPEIGGHSIGWFTPPNGMLPRADLLSERTFGHSGFTGTLLMFDPEYDLTIILLTNRVYSPGEGGGLLRLRRLFVNAIAGALTEPSL